MRVVRAVIGWLIGALLIAIFSFAVLRSVVGDDTSRTIMWIADLALAAYAFYYVIGDAYPPEKAFGADITTVNDRAVELESIRGQVERRFHGRVFIRTPEMLKKALSKSHDYAVYDDENWRLWKIAFDLFPDQPRTQREAAENEQNFWQLYAQRFTTTDSRGRADLAPHAQIAQFYEDNEIWILRYYFAATGKVIKPAAEEEFRLILAERTTKQKFIWGDENSIEAAKKRSDLERLTREIEQYQIHTMRAHFDKWGKWFVAHIEDQFRRDHKPDQPSSDEVHGSGGFASAEDINGLRARGPATPSAHQQSFRD